MLSESISIINLLILVISVAFSLVRKDVLSLLSWFSSIKLIFIVDDCSRRKCIFVFGFVILAFEHSYSRESIGQLASFQNILIGEIQFIANQKNRCCSNGYALVIPEWFQLIETNFIKNKLICFINKPA